MLPASIRGTDPPTSILIGIVGGYVGSRLGLGTVTGFNVRSFLLALGGAVVLLILYRLVKGNNTK